MKIGTLRSDVILLDTRLAEVSGLEVCRRIKDDRVGSRVLILTSFADDNTILKAMQAGADGYLLKDIDETDIAAAIRRVHAGGVVMSPEAGQIVVRGRPPQSSWGRVSDELTGQERRVTELVTQGRTNREVAMMLGLTEKTVRHYLSRAFERPGVQRRAQLAALLARKT